MIHIVMRVSLEGRGRGAWATADTLADTWGWVGRLARAAMIIRGHPSPPDDLACRRRAHAVRQGRRPAGRRSTRSSSPSRSCRHMLGELGRRAARLHDLGQRRPQPHLQQHRARSARSHGRRRACHDPRVFDRDGVLDQHDRGHRGVGHAERHRSHARARRRRREPEPHPARARPVAVRLDSPRSRRRARSAKRSRTSPTFASGDVKLYIPSVSNRTTGKSMGEHTELTAREWDIPRQEQDEIALASHRHAVAARERGFFDDLVIRRRRQQARHDSTRATRHSTSSPSCRRRSTARAARAR